MAAKHSRYLGVQPFKTSDKHIFFGRDEDIENLHDFIILEKLTVLFGKSGYGKSSLLNAGIVPLLNDPTQAEAFRFQPVEVRFGTYVEGKSFSPHRTLLETLKNNLTQHSTSANLMQLLPEDNFWRQFKTRQQQSNGQFVLIFDQFEEFFSYPSDEQELFRKQLAELLYTTIPQVLRDNLEQCSEQERRELTKPMNIKAVFAIRSDRMSSLDSMKDVLPAILHKRYELRPLTPRQAKDAIEKPAAIRSAEFDTPPFEYTKEGLDAVISALTTSQQEGKIIITEGIEAFQLQILCAHLENEVKAGNVPDIDGNGLPDITPEQLPVMKNLYRNYYLRKLDEIAPAQRSAAVKVLENGLLTEDSASGEGRRMSVDSRALIAQFSKEGLDDALLEDLEKTYLIRREVNTVGGFSFELSHDTLIEPIVELKKERLLREEKERLEQERIAAEAKAQEEEAKRKEAEEKRKEAERLKEEAENAKNQALTQRRYAILGLCIAVVAALYALQQTQKAKEAEKLANERNISFLNEKINNKRLEISSLEKKNDVYQKSNDSDLIEENNTAIGKIKMQIDSLNKEIDRIGK